MKLVMIAYNEAMDMEVMEVLEHCAVKNYSKMTGTYGKGTASGTHLGNDIWPGRNNILLVACTDEQAQKIMACSKELKKMLGKEGIKAFVLPLEEMS